MPLDTENWPSPTMGHSFGVPVPSPVLSSAFYLGQHRIGNGDSTDFGRTIGFWENPSLGLDVGNGIDQQN